MMMNLCCDVLKALEGRTLSVAESCTGGGIGASLTAVSGASKVFVGGVISYTNEIKNRLLGIKLADLEQFGAVSEPVARAMASGVRSLTGSDVAVSVTGLAGPDGDEFGRPVGTVFVGFDNGAKTVVKQYRFDGDREAVRRQAAEAALRMIMDNI